MRSVAVAVLTVGLLLEVMAPQPAFAAQARGGSSWSAVRGQMYVYQWENGRRFSPGDTLRLRQVLYNGADSVNTVFVRPCGYELITDGVDLAGVTGVGDCASIARGIEPGDSIWSGMTGVVTSAPGRYRIAVQFLSFEPDDVARQDTSWIDIDVLQLTDAERARAAFYRTEPWPKVPYLLDVTGDTTRTSQSDVRAVVEHAIGPEPAGYLPYNVEPIAAAAISRSRPYLHVEVSFGARGRYQIAVSWVSRVQAADDSARLTCSSSSGGATTRQELFGAILHEKITRAVYDYYAGACGRE